MAAFRATNAQSSNIFIEKRSLKRIAKRTDGPGLIHLATWIATLTATGTLIWYSLGTPWAWAAMFVHGIFLTVPSYALSHETAHGTAFRTRWLNEAVFWVTSFLYLEEPLHRRYTHTSHHTHTWHVGKDAQMPFDTPMDLKGWLMEVSGLGLLKFHMAAFRDLALKRYSNLLRSVTPEGELPKMTRNARIMLTGYAAILIAPAVGVWWPIWLIVMPGLLGAPVMLLFTLIQHVEMQENSPSIVESTRSFRTGLLGQCLYMNMNNHIEHHLFPQVPFHGLPKLAQTLKDQLPDPDPGFFRTNLEVLNVVIRRTLGRGTKAASIRQAPHMISDGGPFVRVAQRTM